MKVKGNAKERFPFSEDVKKTVAHHLKLDAARRRNLHNDGDDAFIFQPILN